MVGVSEISPLRAIVVPRGRLVGTAGEVLPLEMHVRALFRRHRVISIVGPSGSGKSTALAHLAASLHDLDVGYFDESPDLFAAVQTGKPAIVAMSEPQDRGEEHAAIELSPWGESEWIDYLLARHPARVRAVMDELKRCRCLDDLEGLPRFWTRLLEGMAQGFVAADDVQAFLAAELKTVLEPYGKFGDYLRRKLADAALRHNGESFVQNVPSPLRLSAFRRMAAIDVLVESIGEENPWWARLESRRLIRAIAERVAASSILRERLRIWIEPQRPTPELLERFVACLGVMVQADPTYRPQSSLTRNFQRAQLAGVKWARIDLPGVGLFGANLAGADLTAATLTEAFAPSADFSGASLARATMINSHLNGANFTEASAPRAIFHNADARGIIATAADFNEADFERAQLNDADLRGASFRGASLRSVLLTGVQLEATDLRGADLLYAKGVGLDFRSALMDGVHAPRASLQRCRFDGMMIDDLHLPGARLMGSDFTASRIRGARFSQAGFHEAGLADIDWPEADLRNCDFTHAAFHMRSSRSGLIDSPIACEGSRTGFYTDDYSDQDYKPTEEIRRANLCGADLHGANVTGTDWYLVDLRGANYTTDQAEWFRKCGAILYNRRR